MSGISMLLHNEMARREKMRKERGGREARRRDVKEKMEMIKEQQ